VRREAAAAVARLGAVDELPKGAAAALSASATEHDRLVDLLENGRTCKDRKRAVAPLRELGDARAALALERARDRRGGWFGLERANACMMKELNDAIRALEGRK